MARNANSKRVRFADDSGRASVAPANVHNPNYVEIPDDMLAEIQKQLPMYALSRDKTRGELVSAEKALELDAYIGGDDGTQRTPGNVWLRVVQNADGYSTERASQSTYLTYTPSSGEVLILQRAKGTVDVKEIGLHNSFMLFNPEQGPPNNRSGAIRAPSAQPQITNDEAAQILCSIAYGTTADHEYAERRPQLPVRAYRTQDQQYIDEYDIVR